MSGGISGSAVVSEKNKSLTLFVPRSFFLKCLFFVISRYFYCISRYQPAVYPASHGLFLQRRNPFGASEKLTFPEQSKSRPSCECWSRQGVFPEPFPRDSLGPDSHEPLLRPAPDRARRIKSPQGRPPQAAQAEGSADALSHPTTRDLLFLPRAIGGPGLVRAEKPAPARVWEC
jgi:hypothetical protein